MNLAIDAVGVKGGGGGGVLQDILKVTESDKCVNAVYVFCSPRLTRDFDLTQWRKVTEISQPEVEGSYLRRLWWFERGISEATRRTDADCLLCMAGAGVGPLHVPTAIFIQNSLPFSNEALAVCDLSLRVRMAVLRRMMKRACDRAAVVVTQTPTMKSWVLSAFGLPVEKIIVSLPHARKLAIEGENCSVETAMMAVPADRRFLYVGTDYAYKNLQRAREATKIVREKYPGARLFVSFPNDHPLCDDRAVQGLGYLRGASLRTAYRLATAFVMPSLVESGTLTPLESMSLGTPVLAADRPYAHDTCEDAAEFFDPSSAVDLASKMMELIQDERRRTALVQRGAAVVARRREGAAYEAMIEHLLGLATAWKEKSLALTTQ